MRMQPAADLFLQEVEQATPPCVDTPVSAVREILGPRVY